MDLSSESMNHDCDESSCRILDLKRQHNMFAEEAFTYLFEHFGIRTQNGWMFRYFSEAMGRAVVTIAYIFRRRIMTFFKTSQMNPSDIGDFVKFAEYFETVKTPCYFFCILRRISHIFELTLYCLREGYDYTETARNIVACHEDILFFEINGGWARLHETASFIAEVGELLQPVIKMENPQDVYLKSFVEIVQLLETSPFYSIAPEQRKIIALFKRDAVDKLSDIHTLDPRVAKVFYNTICQHSSCVFALNSRMVYDHLNCYKEFKLDIQSEKERIVYSFRNQIKIILGETEDLYLSSSVTIKLAGYFAIFRHLSDLISTELEMAHADYETRTQSKLSLSEKSCVSLNEYFIVHCEYIRKWKSLDIESSQERSVESVVRKILFENIDQNNYFLLHDGRYVVYRPDCKFDCNTTTIVTIPD